LYKNLYKIYNHFFLFRNKLYIYILDNIQVMTSYDNYIEEYVMSLPGVEERRTFNSVGESGNTFTVTGTNSSGSNITEHITGETASNTAVGSTKFATITSITTSATASGNIKIGTIAQ
jgi:hypothetical protein